MFVVSPWIPLWGSYLPSALLVLLPLCLSPLFSLSVPHRSWSDHSSTSKYIFISNPPINQTDPEHWLTTGHIPRASTCSEMNDVMCLCSDDRWQKNLTTAYSISCSQARSSIKYLVCNAKNEWQGEGPENRLFESGTFKHSALLKGIYIIETSTKWIPITAISGVMAFVKEMVKLKCFVYCQQLWHKNISIGACWAKNSSGSYN